MEGKLSYKFPAEDGSEIERHFDFGNYALEQTLTDMDASVTDISDLLNKKLLPFIRTFIYHAAAYPFLVQRKEVEFTPFDVHAWIDSAGGTNGDFIIKASKCIYASLGVGEATEQKKSNLKAIKNA